MERSRFSTTDASEFVKQQQSKNTAEATKFSVKVVREFCGERGMAKDFQTYEVPAMANLLKDFFSNVRNQGGKTYSKSTLCAIRQGIRRYLQEPPHERSIDIISDPRFKSANHAFNSMLKKARQEGKGQVQHKRHIPAGNYRHIFSQFHIFVVIRYVRKKTSEQTKNHTGITNEDEGDGARMYATGTKMCPVSSFEKYIAKRNPDCDALLQYSCGSYLESDDCWFERKPLGKNSIGQFMVKLSKEAELSDTYTNHCVRATTITVLNDVGFKDRDIVSVSGHRNEKSLASYVADTRVDTKRNMSDALSTITNNLDAVVPAKPTSTCSHAPVNPCAGPSVIQDESCINFLDYKLHTQNQQIQNSMSAPYFNFNNCVVNMYNK
ncbi:PREDICTED: uncharacterized protein LOC106812712 [Priapulus caudatus]|uniref:Uncharacterized protein LOC106812712 n=1 Tax=Priapulus caudatus TaxID=37621 RepID=A0ABM1EIW9_PRICU|nr:PREDICTED: uncharacterized protein LOC106812712 [Priapulus caudatus]